MRSGSVDALPNASNDTFFSKHEIARVAIFLPLGLCGIDKM
jgi:hypothetical protein